MFQEFGCGRGLDFIKRGIAASKRKSVSGLIPRQVLRLKYAYFFCWLRHRDTPFCVALLFLQTRVGDVGLEFRDVDTWLGKTTMGSALHSMVCRFGRQLWLPSSAECQKLGSMVQLRLL